MTIGEKIVVLNEGKIQQYDSPDVIYNQPKNVFVAKFIGAPSMNIEDAAVDGFDLVVSGTRVPIPAAWREKIGGRTKVKFGIRPEHVELMKEPAGPQVQIHYVENQGDKKSIAFLLDGVIFMATAGTHFETQDTMYLKMDWDKMHIFDADTTENVGYPEGEERK